MLEVGSDVHPRFVFPKNSERGLQLGKLWSRQRREKFIRHIEVGVRVRLSRLPVIHYAACSKFLLVLNLMWSIVSFV